MKRFILLLFLLVSGVTADTDFPERTGGLFNGRYWDKLESLGDQTDRALKISPSGPNAKLATSLKYGFLIGYLEGLNHVAANCTTLDEKAEKDFYPKRLNFGKLKNALDSFYNDPVNKPIPIAYAIEIIAAQARGDSPEKVSNMTAAYRRISAAISK